MNVNNSDNVKKLETSREIDKFKCMIKKTNDVDNLIKRKKEILENKAKDVVVDFDIIFYQFKVIEKNMYNYEVE